jgi:16S rRNA (cytosine967-C5)-methyltransferase
MINRARAGSAMNAHTKASAALSSRSAAASALHAVLWRGVASDAALSAHDQHSERNFVQALLFASLRNVFLLRALLKPHIQREPAPQVYALMMTAAADFWVLQNPGFACVDEAVKSSRALGFDSSSGLVNAVLRKVIATPPEQIANLRTSEPQVRYELPSWLLDKISADDLVLATSQQPAMWLRLHAKQNLQAYCTRLSERQIDHSLFVGLPHAIELARAQPVANLPFFAEGALSIQDGAAQLAAHLLGPKPRELILDACAAPGGKTAHLLSLAPHAEVTAVDSDGERLALVDETLQRLKLRAKQLVCADAAQLPKSLGAFDKILLDAPCSATGVIRRHPDIAHLRRATDVAKVVKTQASLLRTLWQRLKPGGQMLYATCSILPEENQQQIAAFLGTTPSARLLPWPAAFAWFGRDVGVGRQNSPWQNGMDGFFYALLAKNA